MITMERMKHISNLVNEHGIDNVCEMELLPRKTILDYLSRYKKLMSIDGEMILENVKLEKSRQKFMDRNRIERKSFRNYARFDNALSELDKELINVFKTHQLKKFTKTHNTSNQSGIGLVHLSDLHLNELVMLPTNRYDFSVASKRIKKYAMKVKSLFKNSGFKTVVIADTGDKLNSDRRLDEILSNATNRSQAQFIAVEILRQFILDIAEDFNVVYSYVLGNESRIDDEMTWNELTVTNNYDYNIVQILKIILEKDKRITFIEPENPNKTHLKIGSKNVLLVHGTKFGNDPHKNIKSLVRLYADRDICIHYVIFGHIHEAMITDKFSRGASLVGANAYSEDNLTLTSLASQNIHFFWDNGDIDSMRIDLQNASNKGYEITKELEAYNAKSAKKNVTKKTIFEVVI